MVLDATRTTTTASRPSSTWQRVIVRSPPRATFAQCVVGGDGHAANGDAIDVDLALAQWRAYVDMLRSCVDQVVEVGTGVELVDGPRL